MAPSQLTSDRRATAKRYKSASRSRRSFILPAESYNDTVLQKFLPFWVLKACATSSGEGLPGHPKGGVHSKGKLQTLQRRWKVQAVLHVASSLPPSLCERPGQGDRARTCRGYNRLHWLPSKPAAPSRWQW